ncbi:MAG: hypothetical protein ACRDIA_06870, partial [Actinomycetota bacterium]
MSPDDAGPGEPQPPEPIDPSVRGAGVKGTAVVLAALAALAATVGLPYTKWYWADVARGVLSALILLLVLRVAAGDQSRAIRAREAAGAGRAAKATDEGGSPAVPRRRLYIWICVIFGLGSMVYNVVSFMRADPECGGNPARVLTRGPEVRVGEAEGRRGDVDLLKGRVAALCVAQAKDAATSTALGMTVAIALAGSAVYDATRPVPTPWTKVAWFTYFGFFGTPPARWQLNFWFITGGLALGLVLVSVIVSRTRVVDDKAKLDIPSGKLAATGLVAALLAGGGAKVLNDRNESACEAAEARGLAANRAPQI